MKILKIDAMVKFILMERAINMVTEPENNFARFLPQFSTFSIAPEIDSVTMHAPNITFSKKCTAPEQRLLQC